MTIAIEARELERRRINQLDLDAGNPRFGALDTNTDQRDVLGRIVDKFGVDDVISSIAANGFFEAEPLVVTERNGRFVVREGNRRLAACLILAGDPRARDQSALRARHLPRWKEAGEPPFDPAPTITFGVGEEKKLLAYLGVRHIASSLPWDSFAKAHWAAQMIEGTSDSLRDIARMIGDDHQTMSRMVEAYYVAKQLEDMNEFNPSHSLKKGTGSVSDYPFSWVYTLLSNTAAREYLDLNERSPCPDPISTAKVEDAGFVFRAMFGDSSKGQDSLIGESRALSRFARALKDDRKVALLKSGRKLDIVEEETKPVGERLRDGLIRITDIQKSLVGAVNAEKVSENEAEVALSYASESARLARSIRESLQKVVSDDDDD